MDSLLGFEVLICIAKTNLKIVFSSHLKNLYFEKFSSRPTMVGPIVNSGYERISNTLSMNCASKISKMALL